MSRIAGISQLSIFEIFSNADDLSFAIGESGGKFGIGIFRGPLHNYKPIVTSKPRFESIEIAATEIGEILKEVIEFTTRELTENPHSLASTMMNPGGRNLSEAENALNLMLVERIVEQLKKTRNADTSEMVKLAN